MSTSRVFAVLFILTAAVASFGQPMPGVPCTSDSHQTNPSQVQWNWDPHFIALTRLGNQYMPSLGDGDSMTEPLWRYSAMSYRDGERWGASGMQETWYIARDNAIGRSPLFRLYSPSYSDHMDSLQSNEGASFGFASDLTHGYVWNGSRPAGTSPLARYFNGSIFDHRLWFPGVTPPNYVWDQQSLGYGYKRYGNQLDRCSAITYSPKNRISNSVVTVSHYELWGNAIGSAVYQGMELVADKDIGYLVQGTIFPAAPAEALVNPTQSGGVDSYNGSNTRLWAGSPVLSQAASSNPTLQTATFDTWVKPMNYAGNVWTGSDGNSPMLWRGQMHRITTLTYTTGNGYSYPEVISVTTGANLDSDMDDAAAALYAPETNLNSTFWLLAGPLGGHSSMVVKKYDAPTDTTTVFPSPAVQTGGTWICNDDFTTACSPWTGAIVSSTSADFAEGIVNDDTAPQGTKALKVMFWCDGALNCDTAHQLFILDSFANRTIGKTQYGAATTHWIVGPEAIVRHRMRQIYCDRTGACIPNNTP